MGRLFIPTFKVIYVRPEEGSVPSVAAEWLDGTRQVVELKDFSGDDIATKIKLLSHQSTAEENILRNKTTSTQMPSIQGFNYHCMIDSKPLNLTELPETKLEDAWESETEDSYYRGEEKIKILQRPLPSGPDRKNSPIGPFALDKDRTDYHY